MDVQAPARLVPCGGRYAGIETIFNGKISQLGSLLISGESVSLTRIGLRVTATASDERPFVIHSLDCLGECPKNDLHRINAFDTGWHGKKSEIRIITTYCPP